MANYSDNGGYVSMLNPEMFAFQQQLLAKKDQQYDMGYSIALNNKDKYSQFDSDIQDADAKKNALDQFTANANNIVKTKYNGDWGKAAKEVASTVTEFKADPIWDAMTYAKEQRKIEQGLTARFGPNNLNFNPLSGRSIVDKEGKIDTNFQAHVEERLDDNKVMNDIWNELKPKSLSGTYVSNKVINGVTVPVIVDQSGNEINPEMVKEAMGNMMEIYKKTPNYEQRIREYTKLGRNGEVLDESSAAGTIQQDFLNVGMSKVGRPNYNTSWRPIDLGDFTNELGNPFIKYNQQSASNEEVTKAKKILSGKLVFEKPSAATQSIVNGVINEVNNSPEFQNINYIDKAAERRLGRLFPNYNSEELNKLVISLPYDKELHKKRNEYKQPAFSGSTYNVVTTNPYDKEVQAETNKRKEIISNHIKASQPNINDSDLEKSVNIIMRSANREAIKISALKEKRYEEIAKGELGSTNTDYFTPDTSTKAGQKVQSFLDDANKKIKPSMVTFTAGKYAGMSQEEITAAYNEKGAKVTSPKIVAGGANDLQGGSFMFEAPNGEILPGNLTGLDPGYIDQIASFTGSPAHSIMNIVTEQIKPEAVIPGTVFMYHQNYSDKAVTRTASYEEDGVKKTLKVKDVGAMVGALRQALQQSEEQDPVLLNTLDMLDQQISQAGSDNIDFVFPDKLSMYTLLTKFE